MPGSPPKFAKGEDVEYRLATDGKAWVSATVVAVELDEALDPFYTILLTDEAREKGTVEGRLRKEWTHEAAVEGSGKAGKKGKSVKKKGKGGKR